MFQRLRASEGWQFFSVLPRADRPMAVAWWLVLTARGLLPVGFAVAMGGLIGAVQHGAPLAMPLTIAGAVFVLLQVLSPLHQALSTNLGSKTAAWLYDELTRACVGPSGLGHLEDPRLTTDLTMARDFDLGISGPPLGISMGFIAGGLVEMVGGLASAVLLLAFAWWRRSCSRGRGWRPTICCAKRRSGRTAIPRRCAPPSAMRIMRTGSPSTRPRRKSCACSVSRVGRSIALPVSGGGCLSCVGRRRA